MPATQGSLLGRTLAACLRSSIWHLNYCRWCMDDGCIEILVSLSSEPYCFSEEIVFFSQNKSTNNTFRHNFSMNRIIENGEPKRNLDM